MPTRSGSIVAPTLYVGEVLHSRLRPVLNRFRYGVFYVCVPLSQVAQAENRWFSHNRFNLFSLHDRDYGPGDGTPPERWVRALLADKGIDAPGEIVLHTFPRVLGYVFNPVSFWYCHGADGHLRAVVSEVNNTFGERHCYLLFHPDGVPIVAGETLLATKCFHVSPFFPVAGGYRFRFRLGADRSLARIDHFDGTGDLLHTSISGAARAWTPGAFARVFLTHPFMTLGIIARIHWQALRLLAKRVPFFRKPAPPEAAVSR